MKQLPKSVIALVVALTFFFNIERLDLGEQNFINIASIIYFLVTLSCLVTLRLPILFKLNPSSLVLFWQAIYLLVAWRLLNRGLADDKVYLYFTEMTFLSIVVLLSQAVARHIMDFEEAVANITFTGINRPRKPLAESIAEIQNQMLLSRRYDRPLGLIVLETEPSAVKLLSNQAVLEIQQTMMSRYVAASVIRILDHQLRRTDLLVHSDNGKFVIVCPETDRANLQTLVDRIRLAITEQLGVSFNCGTSSFPDAALTWEELLARAESKLKNEKVLESSMSMGSEPEMLFERGTP